MPRGLAGCRGGLSFYQVEANGSATYLDQGHRTRWSRYGDHFRILRFPVGQYSGRRGIIAAARGGYPMPQAERIFINWKPMDPPPT